MWVPHSENSTKTGAVMKLTHRLHKDYNEKGEALVTYI